MFELNVFALIALGIALLMLWLGSKATNNHDAEVVGEVAFVAIFAAAFLGFISAMMSDTIITTILLGAAFGGTVIVSLAIFISAIAMRLPGLLLALIPALILNLMTGGWLHTNLYGAPGVI